MKQNIIQMSATPALRVPHSTNPIIQHIFDCLGKRSIRLISGFWYSGIIESFFIENEQGAAVTVNGERYRAILNEFSFPKIEEDDMVDILFQQEEATQPT